jgi:hypothetical protein
MPGKVAGDANEASLAAALTWPGSSIAASPSDSERFAGAQAKRIASRKTVIPNTYLEL